MNIITLSDYAKNNNISYEAVRKQVARYKTELDGHIIKDGRQQLLDEEAVAFLDSKREKNPVVIINQDKDDTIKALEAENKNLLQRIALLQDDLIKAKDLHIELQGKITEQQLLAERATAAEERAVTAEKENEILSDVVKINEQERAQAKAETAEAMKRAEAAEAEAERLKKRNLWQRIFNRK